MGDNDRAPGPYQILTFEVISLIFSESEKYGIFVEINSCPFILRGL